MRDHAADDGVVLGIAERVGLAVEQAADERLVDQVDGVHRLQDDERVARHRRLRLWWYWSHWALPGMRAMNGEAEIMSTGQRLDQLGLALDVAVEHAGQPRRPGPDRP